MVICGGRNIIVDVLICSDSILRQFSDNELLVSQLCISVMQLLSKFMSLLESIYSVTVCHQHTSDSIWWGIVNNFK